MRERTFTLVGAPFSLGSRAPGSALAPDALRASGLSALVRSDAAGVPMTDAGDVVAASTGDPESNPRNLAQLTEYSKELMSRLATVYESGACPVVVGGDHSISMPSVSSAALFLRESCGPDAKLGLIWLDAHPDLETPDSTPSGDLHGMSAAVLMGSGAPELVGLSGPSPAVSPEDVAFVGLSDIMKCEREFIESHDMVAYTATDIARFGIASICDRVFGHMEDAVDGYVLSFDVDACDPSEAPGVEYPERGGLTFREAMLVAEYAADSRKLICLEVVEVDPELDQESRSSRLATAFIRSVMTGRAVFRGRPRRPGNG